MKPILLLLIVAATALRTWGIEPDVKVTNKQFPANEGGGGSHRIIDAEKRESIESFISDSGKLRYRIIYQLDNRLQPASALYYNAAGKMFQRSVYTLTDAVGPKEVARIEQEVVYDYLNRFVCTKNYIYGTNSRTGNDSVQRIDTYDINGKLLQSNKRPAQSQQPPNTPAAPAPRARPIRR